MIIIATVYSCGTMHVCRSRAVLIAAAVTFIALSFDHLSVFPPVGQDEPWIAAAPYKLAVQGVYGSDLFAGYSGAERRNYQHMPLYPLLQAAVFKAAGVGVFQMRVLPVFFGLALLLVVFLVGSRLADPRVGATAAVLMLVLAISAGPDATGILLLDRARINRYDMAVPVFGLLALWIFAGAERSHVRRSHVVTGILTGLASLSHLFGAFWLPVFLGLTWRRTPSGGSRILLAGLVLAGFTLACIPWIVYIASGWNDFVGQMRFVAPRFDVFNPWFYVANVRHGGGPISLDWLAQSVGELPWHSVGAWTTIAGVPIAACVIAWSARHHPGHNPRMRMLAVVSLAQFAMFLALLRVKAINYMIGLWPLGVLMLAWLGIWLWERRRIWVRVAVVALFALIAAEGTTRIVQSRVAARETLSYDVYTRAIAACIPSGSLVLGLQRYWLGLRQYAYRTWLVPAIYANPSYHDPPVPLDVTLDRIDPDIILIDRDMATFFSNASWPDHAMHSTFLAFERFMASRHAEQLCNVDNATYGPMRVYRVSAPRGNRPSPDTRPSSARRWR